jgi:hypothetical protein
MIEDLSPVIAGWDRLRLPRLGTIALGVKDERGVPHAVDYFVCPPEVQEVYGPQPRALDVMFPSEDLSVIFPCSYQRWTDQFGLVCRGDGRVANLSSIYAVRFGEEYGIAYDPEQDRFIDARTGEVLPLGMGAGGKSFVRVSCSGRQCRFVEKGKCRPVGRLSFLLPKVPGVLGVYQITTGSVNTYLNIVGGLATLRGLLGRVSFVPVRLRVRVEEAHPVVGSGQEKRQVKTVVPVLYLDMGEWTLERVVEMARERQLIRAVALPPGPAVELEPVDEEEKPDLLFPPEQPEPEGTNAGELGEGHSIPEAPPQAAQKTAPAGGQPAADARAAPAGARPAPAGAVPAHVEAGGAKPAPARDKPAPAGEKPAPAGVQPAPAGVQPAPAREKPAPAGASPNGKVCGDFEVLAPAITRKDREGRDVLVLRVRAVDAEGIAAGTVVNAFSAPGLHPYARQTLAGAKQGATLLLEGRMVRPDALVVDQALVPSDS